MQANLYSQDGRVARQEAGDSNDRDTRRLGWRLLLLTGVLALIPTCARHGVGGIDQDASDAIASAMQGAALGLLERTDPLPNRSELVDLSQKLEVAASAQGSRTSARGFKLAADLRVRSWRLSHVPHDARDAVRLYEAALQSGSLKRTESCWMMQRQLELTAELSLDPRAYFRGAYLGTRVFREGACAQALAEATTLLSAYGGTSEEELRGLELEAERRRAGLGMSTSADVGAANPVRSKAVRAGKSDARPHVISVVPYSSIDRARVVVNLSAVTPFEFGTDPADGESHPGTRPGPRWYLDLPEVVSGSHREVGANGLVERVREQAHLGGTRIVFALASNAYGRVFSLPAPFRIVVDVATQAPRPAAAPHKKRPVARVVLDPGHGGADPGATGPSGLREKDVTLDIAHRAAPVLSREMGIATMLTRDGDWTLSLDERTARANAFHADLFVSIHCNASDSTSAHGVMSFILDATRDEVAARIAARENATPPFEESEPTAPSSALQASDTHEESRTLADLLQRATLASLSQSSTEPADLGIRKAGFFVLMGAEMPAVLYETAFISNAGEERKLASAEYRQKFADSIVNAVRAFREGR